jgi:hypothetical protein
MTSAQWLALGSAAVALLATLGGAVGAVIVVHRYARRTRAHLLAAGRWTETAEAARSRSAAEREEQQKQAIRDIERHRTQRERFDMRPIAGWMWVGPTVTLLIGVLGLLALYATAGEDRDIGLWVWTSGSLALALVSMGLAGSLEQRWQLASAVKLELGTQDRFAYDASRLYTDSVVRFVLYRCVKVIAVTMTLVFYAALAMSAFIWLGSITIAPTTIIIVLLILILLK